ncbi:MAG TPA: glycosyltransferase [Anaerolineaceae bacterium]|nr:glycosyltransferase [Anaerolineaceae bacterium]HQH84166.1 glycosyltransferase [Anaerolineaceae bacterium]
MTPSGKDAVKRVLGQIPFAAELYWLVRQNGRPISTRFSLKHLQTALPEVVQQAAALRAQAPAGRKVFIFATLHYWIEHAAMLAVGLAAQGHEVTLGFLPYAEWQKPINRFDLRRQNAYARRVLAPAESLIRVVSFINTRAPYTPLPANLVDAVKLVSSYDSQYTLQVEDVDPESEIYKLRMLRNKDAAQSALAWLRTNRPDVVIVPNGTIQELGVVYRVARSLGIPAVTYEFSEQRQRIWLAQNDEIMSQNTDTLWEACQVEPLSEPQIEKMRSLMMARQRGMLWENFARLWQGAPAQGGEQARQALGLDDRPVVLLATNVLGDSLTLGRQVFSHNMAEWITRTVQYFIERPDIQLVIRVHPGETLTHGQSMVDVIHSVLPKLPEHIRVIKPDEKINTYDLVDVADLGLVYTTTVGMEMAMNGVPVIVAGKTHYRNRGFTHDPDSWVAYFKLLGHLLENPAEQRLTREQVQRAWQYAYAFFFHYPRPFPWHLVKLWEDVKTHPLNEVFGPEGQAFYGETFNALLGEALDWKATHDEPGR